MLMGVFHIHQKGLSHNLMSLEAIFIDNNYDIKIGRLQSIRNQKASCGKRGVIGYMAPEIHKSSCSDLKYCPQ